MRLFSAILRLRMRDRWMAPTWVVVLLASTLTSWSPAVADDGRQEPNPKVLIEELASPEFEVRRLAQEQLQAMGLGAFDALLEAQFHEDVEVAHRARFILRSMSIEWVKESDPKDVKLLLRNYGKADPIDRRTQIEALAQLEDQRGVTALCRLSNYEFDPILSKFAALQIMQMDLSEAPLARQQIIRVIEVFGRPSHRPASKWLREYAHWLEAPSAALPVWKQIVEEERTKLAENSPSTSREMASLLYVWYADALRSQSLKTEAIVALRQTLDFLEADERQVRDAVIGLISRDAHVLVDELSARYADLFRNNQYLCYLHAESLQSRVRPAGEATPLEQIDGLVNRAMELSGDRTLEHKVLADFLEQRGQFAWCEKESRAVLANVPVLAKESTDTRGKLSELLGELGRFDDASELLKPLIDEFAKGEIHDDAEEITGRYHLFHARSAAQRRQFPEQKAHLKAAVDANLTDSDVIIDMFRAQEADPTWKELTNSYIKAATREFEENINGLETKMTEAQAIDGLQSHYNGLVALEYNQYAWLVANTSGDFDKALARSRQSLELYPLRNLSTFQDTLARCYYAKGDFQNAVKYQRMAVKQEPHAPAMRRQLELFENAAKNGAKMEPSPAKEQNPPK